LRLENILDKAVLIIKRFDRYNEQFIPFLSAMSMIGARDNEQHSYLELACALSQYGAFPDKDMVQLWRRIVFFVMVSNMDDHLRNHGFLYERYNGWKLSPAYDMNPTPIDISPRVLTMAIDLTDTNASLETAMCVAKEFRLHKKQALYIMEEVSAPYGSGIGIWCVQTRM